MCCLAACLLAAARIIKFVVLGAMCTYMNNYPEKKWSQYKITPKTSHICSYPNMTQNSSLNKITPRTCSCPNMSEYHHGIPQNISNKCFCPNIESSTKKCSNRYLEPNSGNWDQTQYLKKNSNSTNSSPKQNLMKKLSFKIWKKNQSFNTESNPTQSPNIKSNCANCNPKMKSINTKWNSKQYPNAGTNNTNWTPGQYPNVGSNFEESKQKKYRKMRSHNDSEVVPNKYLNLETKVGDRNPSRNTNIEDCNPNQGPVKGTRSQDPNQDPDMKLNISNQELNQHQTIESNVKNQKPNQYQNVASNEAKNNQNKLPDSVLDDERIQYQTKECKREMKNICKEAKKIAIAEKRFRDEMTANEKKIQDEIALQEKRIAARLLMEKKRCAAKKQAKALKRALAETKAAAKAALAISSHKPSEASTFIKKYTKRKDKKPKKKSVSREWSSSDDKDTPKIIKKSRLRFRIKNSNSSDESLTQEKERKSKKKTNSIKRCRSVESFTSVNRKRSRRKPICKERRLSDESDASINRRKSCTSEKTLVPRDQSFSQTAVSSNNPRRELISPSMLLPSSSSTLSSTSCCTDEDNILSEFHCQNENFGHFSCCRVPQTTKRNFGFLRGFKFK